MFNKWGAEVIEEPKDVHEAMVNIMEAVPYIRKTKSQGLNYTFASEAELIKSLHDAMCKNSLSVYPAKVDVIQQDSYQTPKGATMFRVRMLVTYRLTHSPSKTFLDAQVASEAVDTSDKAIPKAMTQGLKYALRQSFLIETGDDPDRVKNEAASNRASNRTATLIERGQESLDRCSTPDDVRELIVKFGAVKSPGDKSELLLRAQRKLKQLEEGQA